MCEKNNLPVIFKIVATSERNRWQISSAPSKYLTVRRINLLKNFRILHLTVLKCLIVQSLWKIAKFEIHHNKVDLETSYINTKSGWEMLHYLSQKKHIESTNWFPKQRWKPSVLSDGSSNVENNDEKELFFHQNMCRWFTLFKSFELRVCWIRNF